MQKNSWQVEKIERFFIYGREFIRFEDGTCLEKINDSYIDCTSGEIESFEIARELMIKEQRCQEI